MKHITLPLIALIASPALAHSGAHAHPHGFEGVLILALLAAGVYVLVKR